MTSLFNFSEVRSKPASLLLTDFLNIAIQENITDNIKSPLSRNIYMKTEDFLIFIILLSGFSST